MKVRLLAAAVTIGLASVAWTTSAAADNPHGTPPGQQKANASATVNASTQTNASAHASGKAQAKAAVAVKAKGQAKAKASGHGAVKTQTQPTVSAGVAPSSATSKNTFAAATSNQTKLYGNGKTAGQIAVESGFKGSTLYGPGNSQPHKTACGVHSIDVHALKAHSGACGTTTAASISAAARVHGHAHGHVGLGVLAHVSATLVAALGMKPASFTSKNTFAMATSNQTKLYGNGTTAGQIALQAGYAGMLHGPGNSQPHKVVCGPHEIDVHALKAHGGAAACASAPTVTTAVTGSVPAVQANGTAPAVQANVAASAAAQAAVKSGVLGATASAPAKAKAQEKGSGVLSAKAKLAATAKKPLRLVATVRHGNLPFTGLSLWMPMLLGLGLIATGLAMRRKGNSLA